MNLFKLKLFIKGHCKFAYKCPHYSEDAVVCRNHYADNYYCGKFCEFSKEELDIMKKLYKEIDREVLRYYLGFWKYWYYHIKFSKEKKL